MAEIDAKRNRFLIEALRYKIRFRNKPIADKLGEWRFEGKGGIFETARRHLPQVYNNTARFPNTPEGNLAYAQEIIYKVDHHQDSTLEEYLKEETAIFMDQQTTQKIDRAIQETAAPQVPPALVENGGVPPTPTTRPSAIVLPEGQSEEIPKPQAESEPAPVEQPTETASTSTQPPMRIPAFSAGVSNLANNLASKGGILSKLGGSRIANGLSSMLKNAGGVGGKLGNLGIRSGEHLVNASNLISHGGLSIPGSKTKIWLLFLGAFILLTVGVGFIGTTSSNQQESSTNLPASGQTSITGLNYTLPLKDVSVTPLDIRDQIRAVFPSAKLEYWDTIVSTTKAAGINPAVALALWVEETGASQTTVIRNGGSGILTSEGNFTLGHLGCAPKEDQTIDESLSCLIKFVNNNNFTNNDFPQFMAKYSSGPSENPFANNPNFPGNLEYWYLRLVPAGVTVILPTASQQPAGCPVVGKITNPYGYNIAGYADSQGNPYINELCRGLPYCHNGIDIGVNPGAEVKSTMNGVVKDNGYDSFKGYYTRINNNASGFSIVYEHLQGLPTVALDTAVQKGQVVGKSGASGETQGAHLHYRIEKNGVLVNPLRYIGEITNRSSYSQYLLKSADDISSNNYSGTSIADVNDFGTCSSSP